MNDIELWAIHAIAAYAGRPLDDVPPEPPAGSAMAVVEALHRLEASGAIVRVEYRGVKWYELAEE